jgi:hypothetical protein
LFDKNVYFVRKTVANGQKILDLGSSSPSSFNLNSYCSIYASELYRNIITSFKDTVSSLNWHSNDLVGESCSNIDSRTIWIPDYHDGPRVDLSSTLAHLGQIPFLAGFKGGKTPFPNSLTDVRISHQISNFVSNLRLTSIREIKQHEILENFEYYRNNKAFKAVDLVICSFPSSMCEAFILLNKTIHFNPAHRLYL